MQGVAPILRTLAIANRYQLNYYPLDIEARFQRKFYGNQIMAYFWDKGV